jgi:hypothetical protein
VERIRGSYIPRTPKPTTSTIRSAIQYLAMRSTSRPVKLSPTGPPRTHRWGQPEGSRVVGRQPTRPLTSRRLASK